MENKLQNPRKRDKEKSKQQFLDAVDLILRTKGYTALKINDIAATSGLDKKLIYNYFGGTEELIDEYIRSQDFWSNITKEDAPLEITDGGEAFTKQMLVRQFDYINSNENLQKILLWGVAEKRKSLKRVADERELKGEELFMHITDPYFKENSMHYRAVMAILISGIYYLNMYEDVNAATFCGIDLTTPTGKDQIKASLEKMVHLVYQDQKESKVSKEIE